MTLPEEPNRDEPGRGTPSEGRAGLPPDDGSDVGRTSGSGDARDYDALFRDIVENYGARPVLDPAESGEDEREDERIDGSRQLPDPRLFDTSHLAEERPAAEPGWHRRDNGSEREEHFVPPEPPPVPRGTPARRLAWLGLFLAPLVMLTAVAVNWAMPDWVSILLVAAFVGGFVFLVATMPRDRRDDGDDGAVV
jgi:hypothetical protein